MRTTYHVSGKKMHVMYWNENIVYWATITTISLVN